MSKVVVEGLRDLISRYGTAVCLTPRMCETFIRQDVRSHPQEITAILAVLNHGVVARMLTHGVDNIGQSAATVAQASGISQASAKWALETWAEALGSATKPQGPETWKDVDAPEDFRKAAQRPVRRALLSLVLVGLTGLIFGAAPGITTGYGIDQRQPWAMKIQQKSRMSSDHNARILNAQEFAIFYGVLGGISGLIGSSMGWMFGGHTRLSVGRVLGAMIGAATCSYDGANVGMVYGGALGAFIGGLIATTIGTFIATLLGTFMVLWMLGRLVWYVVFNVPA